MSRRAHTAETKTEKKAKLQRDNLAQVCSDGVTYI